MTKRPPEGQKEIFNREAWDRSLLHGLACEWEKSLWVLSPPHRKMMRLPLFSLREMEDRWGSWSGKKREISLSRNLVLNHPWDAVCEVLLHEMAHQFTEEVFAAHHEPPHGAQFQKACHLLRANPKASGNYKPLDERIAQGSAGGEARIMVRVKKLMALAESPNQHEAEAAMGKAHELIARYNLDLLAQEEKRNFTSVFVGRPALRHPPEDYALAHLLQDFYFVRGIWVSAYVPASGKMGRVLEISGTTQNIKMASYVHDFVGRFIHSQWAAYNKNRSLNRHRQTDFALGIVEGFRSKLETPGKEKGKAPSLAGLDKDGGPVTERISGLQVSPHHPASGGGLPDRIRTFCRTASASGESWSLPGELRSTGEAGGC